MMKIIMSVCLISFICFSCKKDIKKEKTVVVSTPKMDTVSKSTESDDNDFPEKSDTEYDEVDENDFKKWKGEYFLDYIDYAGENDGTKLKAKLVLESSDNGDFFLWYEKPNDTTKIGMHHVFGSFGKVDDNNMTIKFLPEIITEGDNTGIDLDYFLSQKEDGFYIKSEMIPSENGSSKNISIQKIK